jgi:hypothetical protein
MIGVWSSAQVGPKPPSILTDPAVISGDNIGFRVESTKNGIPIGKLVVRVGGVWKEPEFSAERSGKLIPAGSK